MAARVHSSLLLLACVVAAWLGLSIQPTRARANGGATRDAATKETVRRSVTTGPATTEEDGPSLAVYPNASIPIRFDHETHGKKLGIPCAFCHSAAPTSRRSSDRLLAPADRCDACHGTDHARLDAVTAGVGAAEDCAYCHAGAATSGIRKTILPAPNLRFDHAVHATRGIPCTRCHAEVLASGVATRASLPRMRGCLDCHRAKIDGGTARADCELCHLAASGTRLKTEFVSGKLMPPSWMNDARHDADWLYRHKQVAGENSQFCASCHAESECVDCHDGRVRPRRNHPNDWLNLHALAARQNDTNCGSCHRAQTFCISCHQRTGVAESGPSGESGDRGRFHPPPSVWTNAPRTSRHHSTEAERNISACVSCHTERDCALCHATAVRGGRGGLSPHPPGFRTRCAAALAQNSRPCLYCHDASDPSLQPCR